MLLIGERYQEQTHGESERREHLQRRAGSLLVCAFLVHLLISAVAAHAAENVLWQIGKPDHGTLEFNDRWDFSQGHDPTFVVGKSNPAQDWSSFHPGPLDSSAGHRLHPFTVLFTLNEVPRGIYSLTVGALFNDASIPQYVIDVNGRKGRYYFNPKMTYDIGDPNSAWNIIFSAQELRIPLPAAYLRQGENRLVLTCVGNMSQVILPQSESHAEASGISYDFLKLSHDPAAKLTESRPGAEAHPTIFYRHDTDNRLYEVIVLKATAENGVIPKSATLHVGRQDYSCGFTSEYTFGESECSVEVPEFSGTTQGNLSVSTNKGTRRFEAFLIPAKKWKLFNVPLIHLDMGYTDYRPNSYEVHDRNLDQVIETMEADPNYRFNPDGTFIFEDYWKHRGTQWQQRCLKFLREGRLALPAQLFTLNTGLASQEELIRLEYFGAKLSGRYNLPLKYADQTDVPAHTWAFPSILAGMGIKYLTISSNPFRGPIILYGKLNERSPFWWEGPDGGKVLTWYSRQYSQFGILFSDQPSAADGINSLPIFLQAYASPSYAADAVMLYGTQSDNRPFNPQQVKFVTQWNKEFAYPKVVVSTMVEFFQYMENHFSRSFETLRGDGGAYWDEMEAANARYSAIWRKSKERALAAESAASLGSIVNPGFQFPLPLDHAIWNNLLLYTEHTWGSPRAWMHPDDMPAQVLLRDKESFATQAEIEVDNLLRRGLSEIGDKIYTSGETLVVFNSLSWSRSGLVETDLPRGAGLADVENRRPIPLELVRRFKDESYDRVRFWVEAIPALGYRCYSITENGQAVPADHLRPSSSIENEFYKVTVDPARGGISSVYDKQLGRELVDQQSAYTLDQYVYVDYGHNGATLVEQRTKYNSTLLQYGLALPYPHLELSQASGGKILGVEKTPWGGILTMRSSAAHTPTIDTEVRLFNHTKVIEIVNRLHKEVVKAPEGVYIAFPFAGRQPTIRYEIQNAWVDPTRDTLPGSNKEWFSSQHWIAVSEPGFSIGLAPLEAPLITINDIDRGRWPSTLKVQNGTIFSYIMNNYDGDDERPYQGGDFTFHYFISSERQFDPSSLHKFGRQGAVPFEVLEVTAMDKRDAPAEPLPSSENGFIQLNNQAVVLTTWKAAEDGNGYILRFYDSSGQPQKVEVTFPHLQFGTAYHTNLVEVNRSEIPAEDGRISLALRPHEVLSVRITDLSLK